MRHPQDSWNGRVAAADESFCKWTREGVAEWMAGNNDATVPAFNHRDNSTTVILAKDALIEALDYEDTYAALAEVIRTSKCPQVAALRERLIRNHFECHADPVSDRWALEVA